MIPLTFGRDDQTGEETVAVAVAGPPLLEAPLVI